MKGTVKIRPVKTEQDYESALEEIERLWDSKPGSPSADTLDILATLVEKYEEENIQISTPDPVEAIKFRMEQQGMNKAQLGEIIGGRNRATEVLNRERRLTVTMIRSLHEKLGIPAEALIGDYSLKRNTRSTPKTSSRTKTKKSLS